MWVGDYLNCTQDRKLMIVKGGSKGFFDQRMRYQRKIHSNKLSIQKTYGMLPRTIASM